MASLWLWSHARSESDATSSLASSEVIARSIHSNSNRYTWGQDYKEKHKTRLKTNVKRTVLNNTKLRHFWAQIVSWAPIHARKTFIILAPGQRGLKFISKLAYTWKKHAGRKRSNRLQCSLINARPVLYSLCWSCSSTDTSPNLSAFFPQHDSLHLPHFHFLLCIHFYQSLLQTCHLVRIVRIQYGFWPFLRWYGRITLWYGFEAKYWKTIDELCVAKQNSFIVDTTSFLRKFQKNGRFRPPWMTIDL